MNAFKKTGGFTLVELIIVIAILAILSSVAVAGYSSYIKKANNSAVLAELNNISTAATLANAKAGGIASIVVDATGKFVITPESTFDMTANDTFAQQFATSTGITLTVKTQNAEGKPTSYEGELKNKTNWANSKYAETGKTTTWNGTWGEPQNAPSANP